MGLTAEIVDLGDLWKTVVAAIVAGVGITILFSVTLVGSTRSSEAFRDNRRVVGTAYGLVAMLGLASTLGAVTLGLIVMMDKS